MATQVKWSDQSATVTIGNKAANISGITSLTIATTTSKAALGTAAVGAGTTTSVTPSVNNTTAGSTTNSAGTIYGGTQGQNYVDATLTYTIKYASGGEYSGTIANTLGIKNAVSSVSVTKVTAWASQAATPTLTNTVHCGGAAYNAATLLNASLSGATKNSQSVTVSLSGGNISIPSTTSLSGTETIVGTLEWSADTIANSKKSVTGNLVDFKNDVKGMTVTEGTMWSDASGENPTFSNYTLQCTGAGSAAATPPTMSNATVSAVQTGIIWDGSKFTIKDNTIKINQSATYTATLTWGAGTIGAAQVQKASSSVLTVKEAVKNVTCAGGEVWAATAGNTFTLTVTGYTGGTPFTTPTLSSANTKPTITNGSVVSNSNKIKFTNIAGSFTIANTASWVWSADSIASQSITMKPTVNMLFKNPVASVVLNGSTAASNLYVAAGSSIDISYTVNPRIAGTPYSYAVAVSGTGASKVSASTAVASGTAGKIKFSTTSDDANTSATVLLYSDQASSRVTSATVTIYISSASQNIFLDWGDKKSIIVPTGSTITKWSANATTAPTPSTAVNASSKTGTYSRAEISDTTLTITANKSGSGYDAYQLNSGMVVTVNVSGITVTLS